MKTYCKVRWIALFVGVVFLLPATAFSIDIVTQPSDLNPGDTYHLAFITSLTYQATSTDISWYDAQIAARAAASAELNALGVDWFCIGSTSDVDARDHFSVAGPVYTLFPMHGHLVASDYNDLWDGQGNDGTFVCWDEFGNYNIGMVFTGTSRFGYAMSGIPGPLGSDRVNMGTGSHQGSGWIDLSFHPSWNSGAPSTNFYHLYGISAPLTVPEPQPIPEPTTILLLSTGLVGLLGIGIRRKRKKQS